MQEDNNGLLTFGGHLEVLRQMLFRIISITVVCAIVIFCFKGLVWRVLLAPSEYDFITYRLIEKIIRALGIRDFALGEYHIDLIATDLASQFMRHISTALYLGLICASPYCLFELFRFVSPALYEKERRYSLRILIIVYFLFIIGGLMSYFVIFPISFRFLGTYNVDPRVVSTITLDSYVSTFTSLALIMGLVFQLPILVFVLGKMNILTADMLRAYRKHALFIITAISALITPPDIMSCIFVTLPLYLLYEISIQILKYNY